MKIKKSLGVPAAAFASCALLVAMPGCGGDDNAPIQEEQPIQEALKDSMEFTKQRYAKKGAGRN